MTSRSVQLIKNIRTHFTYNNIKDQVKTYHPYITLGCPIIGTIIGIHKGYTETKHADFLTNLTDSLIGGFFGLYIGGICGIFWPISIPVLTMRIYDRQRLDYSIFEKEEKKIIYKIS